MEKAIEIKRRAQRCILNGDLNGALAEYEKLVAIGDPDPYYCVLLADLLYKMGSAVEAQKRYLEAIQGYAKSGLYKNGIAVCKKMSRLTLAPIEVPRALAQLYSLDGLSTEAGLAYQQLSEVLMKHNRFDEARVAIKQAIEVTPDAARLYERLGEIEVLAGDNEAAGNALSDAAERFERAGQQSDVRRCRSRIAQLHLPMPSHRASSAAPEQAPPLEVSSAPVLSWPAPGSSGADVEPLSISHTPPSPDESDEEIAEAAPVSVVHGFGRLDASLPASDVDDDEADFEVDDESPIEEREIEETEIEETEIEEAPVAPQAKAAAGPTTRKAATPVEPSLSLAGFDPGDYDVDETPETNGPVAAPVEDAERMKRSLPPSRLPAESAPGLARRDEVAPPRAPRATPEPAVAGPPVFRSPAAPPRPMPVTPVASAAPPVAKPPGAGQAGGGPETESPAALGRGGDRFGDEVTPAQPGLGAQPAAESGAESQEDAGLAQVSLILAEAQACFHAGDRDAATIALIRAAQAYDQIGRHDSAVAIYRSLGQSPDVSLQLMMLWLKNCQRRNDREEAARVACELGDRALNDGDVPGAREWFERARIYDPNNELAARRLKALDGGTAAPAEPVAATGATPPASVSAVAGHLNVKTERDEPVIVDLGVLIDEFQRAIEPELASDPQGHYDLGMSYREMGLTEQAVQSLRIAAKAPAFRLRAGELAGRCLLDLGHFDEAADVLRGTLEAPDLLPSAAVDLRYQLALALEAAGRSAEALTEFGRVYAAQANYPDVAMKIRLLRKTAGAA